MKKAKRICIASLAVIVILNIACNREASEEAYHETVLDRIIHFEDSLRTSIPDIPRWCDRLELRSGMLQVGDASLFVEQDGDGVPIVLVNGGWGSSHHYFHPHFSTAADFARIIYYDQRGCGLSDYEPGEGGYSVDQAIEDLEKLRAKLGFERWVVLGHSYGGFLAQYYALRYPEKVSGLVLVGSSTGLWTRIKSRSYSEMDESEIDRLQEIRTWVSDWAEETDATLEDRTALLVYNNFLNGDWKRQHFLRPSPERIAQIAKYDWVHDPDNFRSEIGESLSLINLRGAFENFPVPTLIMEGSWDLTWIEEKASILKDNHPNAQLIRFDNSGHNPFEDEPKKFFEELEKFVANLQGVDDRVLSAYRSYAQVWEKTLSESPEFIVRHLRDDHALPASFTEAFAESWFSELAKTDFYFDNLQKLGFAFYDETDYLKALSTFRFLEVEAEKRGENEAIPKYVGLLWQGHILDLLGRREEAIDKYVAAETLDLNGGWMHPQYNMFYEFTSYAQSRITAPFERIENVQRGNN